MSNGNTVGPQDTVSEYLAPGAKNVKLVYVLYLVSLLVGITVLVGLIIAYVNRSGVQGTWLESHYTYQIRTFWIGILYLLVSIILMFIMIGILLLAALVIWMIIRCVKGLQWVTAGEPVPNPKSWIF